MLTLTAQPISLIEPALKSSSVQSIDPKKFNLCYIRPRAPIQPRCEANEDVLLCMYESVIAKADTALLLNGSVTIRWESYAMK